MIKKEYLNPAIEVVELKYQSQILAGSLNDKLITSEEVDDSWAPELELDDKMFQSY